MAKKWTPPKTSAGSPCKRCRPKRPCCPKHAAQLKGKSSQGNRKKRKGPGRKPKLTPRVVQVVAEKLPTADSQQAVYRDILKIGHSAWYEWLDQGESDAGEGLDTLHRRFYETVQVARRVNADEMVGVAREAAKGVQVEKMLKDGPVVYQLPPDGALALKLAARLDPKAMPPEPKTLDVKSDSTVVVKMWDPDGD